MEQPTGGSRPISNLRPHHRRKFRDNCGPKVPFSSPAAGTGTLLSAQMCQVPLPTGPWHVCSPSLVPPTFIGPVLLPLCCSTRLLTEYTRAHKYGVSSVLFTQSPCHCARHRAGAQENVCCLKVRVIEVREKEENKSCQPRLYTLCTVVWVPLSGEGISP